MGEVHILIPAAGASRRMRGADKLLERVGDVPALRHSVDIAAASEAGTVWVTLQPGAEARRAALAESPARIVEVPDWAEGMAASLRAGAQAAAAAGASGLLVILPDMPEIEAGDIRRVAEAHQRDHHAVWRGAAKDGTPGHPVLLPQRLFADMARLSGDQGARAVLAGGDVRLLPLPGRRAITDLDTPEEWAAWRARQP